MKKLPLTLCALLGCTVVLGGVLTYFPLGSAASETSSQSNLKQYINEEKQYSIDFPKDWQKQDLPGLDLVLFSPLKGENSQAHATMNIVSEKVGGSVTLDQFYAESVKHLTTELQEVHVEGSGEKTMGDVSSKWVLYSHMMLKTKFKVLQYLIVSQGNVFLITFSAPVEDFDSYKEVFDNMASSFRLLTK